MVILETTNMRRVGHCHPGRRVQLKLVASETKRHNEKYNLCVPFFTQRWTLYLLAKDQRAFLNGFYIFR